MPKIDSTTLTNMCSGEGSNQVKVREVLILHKNRDSETDYEALIHNEELSHLVYYLFEYLHFNRFRSIHYNDPQVLW